MSAISIKTTTTKFFVSLIFLLAGLFVSWGGHLYFITLPCCFLFQGLIIYKYRNHQFIILMTLYLSIYIAYFIPYFYFHHQLSEYTAYQDIDYYNRLCFLFLLFFWGILVVDVKTNERCNLLDTLTISPSKLNRYIYIIGLAILFVLTLRQGQNVIGVSDSYSVYRSNLETTNSIPLMLVLYLIFFLPIMGKDCKKSFLVVCLIFALFCVSRGLRMVLAPIGVLLFAAFWENKIKLKKLLLLFFLGFIVLLGVNALKMSMDFSLSKALSEGDHEYIVAHHADNLYIGSVGINLAGKGVISFWDRIVLNIGFFAETIVPPTMLPMNFKYPHIVNAAVSTGGGGLFITGAYLMWGYIGVFLFGVLLAKLICCSESLSRNHVVAVIALVTCIFFPRWMSYDFHVILRFSFLALIIFCFFNAKKKNPYYKHN